MRHEAEQAAAGAAAEAALLKAQLHAALARAAELDDSEQAVQAVLDARLQQQAAAAEQLRCVVGTWRVGALSADGNGPCRMAGLVARSVARRCWLAWGLNLRWCMLSVGSVGRRSQHALPCHCLRLAKRRLSGLRAESSGAAEELRQKQELAAELQAKLRVAGECWFGDGAAAIDADTCKLRAAGGCWCSPVSSSKQDCSRHAVKFWPKSLPAAICCNVKLDWRMRAGPSVLPLCRFPPATCVAAAL